MKRLGFVALTLALAACAQTPTSPPPAGGGTTLTSKVGVVYIGSTDASSLGGSTIAAAGAIFQQVAPTTSPASPLAASADTCFVQQGSQPGPDPLLGEPAGTALDAGTPIALKSASGPYATLTPSGSVPGMYSSQVTPLPAPPTGLTVDIPGAPNGFPAFTNAAFPDLPAAVQLTSPQNFSVSSSTTFSWANPSNDPNTLVLLSAVQASPNASVVCVARDDGSFTFPATTRQQLQSTGFVQGQMNYVARATAHMQVQGDAVLYTEAVHQQIIVPAF